MESVNRFQELQQELAHCWESVDQFDSSDGDILVIPSVSLDPQELEKIVGYLHYEERLLFSLIRLRNPRTRIIYVTSEPLHPLLVDYYFQLLPGIPFSHARDRLILFSTYDSSPIPLTQKILDRPRLLERIKQSIHRPHSFMICYNSTPLEKLLSLKLELPLYANDPDLFYWGTKSGSRQIFAECGVPHPDGSPLVKSVDDLAIATSQLWERQPQLNKMVIKLNEGFSGEGNAILNLNPILDFAHSHYHEKIKVIKEEFNKLIFQGAGETWEHYQSRIPELGVIVEAFIEGKVKRSPSVQGRVTPKKEVEILSTHDQILGGPDQQVYLGCQFPSDWEYRLVLQELGGKIGGNLASKGALERYGVDFVTVYHHGKWETYAIEINLRKGGTTHPFMTLRFLTTGTYNLNDGLFYSRQGRAKYYIATDNLCQPHYRGLLPNDLMDIIADHRLHFDTSTETGTVFHLIGCLSQFGKLGLTCIGDSLSEAQDIYHQVINVLDSQTQLFP